MEKNSIRSVSHKFLKYRSLTDKPIIESRCFNNFESNHFDLYSENQEPPTGLFLWILMALPLKKL